MPARSNAWRQRQGDAIGEAAVWLAKTPVKAAVARAASELRAGLTPDALLLAIVLAATPGLRPDVPRFNHVSLVAAALRHLVRVLPARLAPLPCLWAVQYLHDELAIDAQNKVGDWQLPAAQPRDWSVPRASRELVQGLDAWDAEATDAAVTTLVARVGGPRTLELLLPYGMRDQGSIGHKAIFTAAVLEAIPDLDAAHAGSLLRPLAQSYFGLGRSEREADFVPNRRRCDACTMAGSDRDPAGEAAVFAAVRTGSPEDAAAAVAARLAAGHDPAALWDAMTSVAVDLVLCQPGFASLHALTTVCSLQTLQRAQASALGTLAPLPLLQAAAWLPRFRGAPGAGTTGVTLATLQHEGEPGAAGTGDPDVDPLLAAFGAADDPIADRQLRVAASPVERAEAMATSLARHVAERAEDVHEWKLAVAVITQLHRTQANVRTGLLAAGFARMPSLVGDIPAARRRLLDVWAGSSGR